MKDLTSFVLATGDSDFSHLFCHLRQASVRVRVRVRVRGRGRVS